MKFKIYFIFILLVLLTGAYYFYNLPKVGIPLDVMRINSPRDLEDVSGIINVNGEVDTSYNEVYYRVNLGEWKLANGNKNWNFDLDTSNLDKGVNVIYIKAGDKVKAIRINVV